MWTSSRASTCGQPPPRAQMDRVEADGAFALGRDDRFERTLLNERCTFVHRDVVRPDAQI